MRQVLLHCRGLYPRPKRRHTLLVEFSCCRLPLTNGLPLDAYQYARHQSQAACPTTSNDARLSSDRNARSHTKTLNTPIPALELAPLDHTIFLDTSDPMISMQIGKLAECQLGSPQGEDRTRLPECFPS